MWPLKDETRGEIQHLCFVERCPLDVIAAELRIPRSIVRRALVIDGGAPRTLPPGPYHKESDS